MSNYALRPIARQDEWSALVAQVEHPHLVQSWAYGEAKAKTGWHPRRLAIDRAGKPVALCLVLDKRLAGVRVASRVNRGPMLLDQADPDIAGIYRALRRSSRFPLGRPLLIGPALPDTDMAAQLARGAGYRPLRRTGWGSAYLDLRQAESELRKHLRQSWRRHLTVSERHGLTLRISQTRDDVAWMIDRHVENMREKGFDKPTAALVRAMHEAAPDDFLVFQVCLDGTPVGGAGIFRFGLTAEYYIAWYAPEGRKVNAGNFLIWNAAIEMQRRGCRYFDLGGYSSGTGYGDFKRPMNGTEYVLLGEYVSAW